MKDSLKSQQPVRGRPGPVLKAACVCKETAALTMERQLCKGCVMWSRVDIKRRGFWLTLPLPVASPLSFATCTEYLFSIFLPPKAAVLGIKHMVMSNRPGHICLAALTSSLVTLGMNQSVMLKPRRSIGLYCKTLRKSISEKWGNFSPSWKELLIFYVLKNKVNIFVTL